MQTTILRPSDYAAPSDITIVLANNRGLKCHRKVLAARSKYFAELMKSEDSKAPYFHLRDVDPASAQAVINSFYTGECTVTLETICGIIEVAQKYHVPDLMAECAVYINKNIDKDNVATMFRRAMASKSVRVLTACKNFLNKHIRKLRDSDEWPKQPFGVAAAMLRLTMKSEVNLTDMCEAAAAWLLHQPDSDNLIARFLKASGMPDEVDSGVEHCMDELKRHYRLVEELRGM